MSQRSRNYSRVLGRELYHAVHKHVVRGFSRTYDSDDPIAVAVCDQRHANGWQMIAEAACCQWVHDKELGVVSLFGRASRLALINDYLKQAGWLEGSLVLSAYERQFYDYRDPSTTAAIHECIKRIQGDQRVLHQIAELYPHLREWHQSTEAEIIMRRAVSSLRAGGSLFTG